MVSCQKHTITKIPTRDTLQPHHQKYGAILRKCRYTYAYQGHPAAPSSKIWCHFKKMQIHIYLPGTPCSPIFPIVFFSSAGGGAHMHTLMAKSLACCTNCSFDQPSLRRKLFQKPIHAWEVCVYVSECMHTCDCFDQLISCCGSPSAPEKYVCVCVNTCMHEYRHKCEIVYVWTKTQIHTACTKNLGAEARSDPVHTHIAY